MHLKLSVLIGLIVLPISARAARDRDVSDTVRLNSLGFRPTSIKTATFLKGDWFRVRRVSDGATLFFSPLEKQATDAVTGQKVFIGEFTPVQTPGVYYIEVSNCDRSPSFAIGDDVYRDAYRTAMLGFTGQRCGTAVSLFFAGETYSHAACHDGDVDLSYFDGQGRRPSVSGGWHDAGDYGRYTVNGAFTAGLMLRTWEDFSSDLDTVSLDIPETDDASPDFLDEVRVQIEWLLEMEYTDGSGRFSNAVKSPEFPGYVMPEDDTEPIALTSASSMGTAAAAAALAQAARVYRPYDGDFADTCEQAALRAYAWTVDHPEMLMPDEAWAAAYDYGDTPGDETSVDLDAAARLWAAAELWVTTDDSNALIDFEARAQASGYAFNPSPDWPDPSDLGIISYLRSTAVERSADVVDSLSSSVRTAAAALQTAYDDADNAWGRVQGYWWGANGTTARSCLVLQAAEYLDDDGAPRDLCAEQIGYLMGRNRYGRSQVTGVGIDPPRHPHHRPSIADGIDAPWPGLLVGGPQTYGGVWMDWRDEEDDYFTNETAINWNASMVYALAGFLGPDADLEGTPLQQETDVEDCVPDPEPDAGDFDTDSVDTTPEDTDTLRVIHTPIDSSSEFDVHVDSETGTEPIFEADASAEPAGFTAGSGGCDCNVPAARRDDGTLLDLFSILPTLQRIE